MESIGMKSRLPLSRLLPAPWRTGPGRAGCALFCLALLGMACSRSEPARAGDKPRPAAPGLEGGIAWLNTAGPLKMEELKGRVVVLDFWTLCCINCIHTL